MADPGFLGRGRGGTLSHQIGDLENNEKCADPGGARVLPAKRKGGEKKKRGRGEEEKKRGELRRRKKRGEGKEEKKGVGVGRGKRKRNMNRVIFSFFSFFWGAVK